MKKVLLLTGALLSLGVLTGCGGKAPKDIDLSVKEMDEKFNIPSGLISADTNFGDYVVGVVQDSLAHGLKGAPTPRLTTYERVFNVNAAIKTKSGFINNLVVDDTSAMAEEVVEKEKMERIPIDTLTRYRQNMTQTVSLYDNYLTDYKTKEDRHYIDERGHNLNYKDTNEQDNYWYEKDEDTKKYKIQNYVKSTKQSGVGEFKYIADTGKKLDTEEEAKTSIETVIKNLVSQMYTSVFQMQVSYTNIPDAGKMYEGGVTSDDFDPQIAYYHTSDYKTLYAFSSYITGINYVYPTGQTVKYSKNVDVSKIIPIYSVETRVGKLSKWGDNMYDWRVDYIGTRGKTYTTKDNNLISYNTPKCISSEYYFINSTYDNIGRGDLPERDSETKTYNNVDFKEAFGGISAQKYTWREYDGTITGDGDIPPSAGRYYRDFTNPTVSVISREMIYPDLIKPSEDGSIELISALIGFDMKDVSVDLREDGAIGEDQFAFAGTWSASVLKPGKGIGMGQLIVSLPSGVIDQDTGVSFGILKRNVDEDTVESSFDITDPDVQSRIMNGDETDGNFDINSDGSLVCREDCNEISAYTLENVFDSEYDITMVLNYENNEITLDSMRFYYSEQGSGTLKDAK